MNAGPTSAWALANPSTVNEPRERVPTCPVAEVITLLRHEESIRQCIVTQVLPLGSVLSDLLSAGGCKGTRRDLRNLVWTTCRCGWLQLSWISSTFKRRASPTRKPELASRPINAT